jgi:putative NADH-flavin reductase
MLPIDLETRADLVILPPEPGGAAALPCRDISVASAIRYVVEELSRDERPRAVVCTPTGSLFINEIEALYDQPEFPKAA